MKLLFVVFILALLTSCDTIVTPSLEYGILIIQPGYETGKDVEVWDMPPYTDYAQYSGLCDTTNFGDRHYFRAATWSYYEAVATHRGFIEFDISDLPKNSYIDSASLFLYSEISSEQTQSGQNSFYLKRVLEPWDEHTIMWYNQPSVANEILGQDYITVTKSISENQDYKIDTTPFVKYWNKNPGENYGIRINLIGEEPLSRVFLLVVNIT